MTIHEVDRAFARNAFQVAIGLVEQRDADARDLARAALAAPSALTVRALLEIGNGRAWRASVIDALAQVGIAAAEDVLGGADDD